MQYNDMQLVDFTPKTFEISIKHFKTKWMTTAQHIAVLTNVQTMQQVLAQNICQEHIPLYTRSVSARS
eukprot:15350065-Ditylum_brightwellii.AAC.1